MAAPANKSIRAQHGIDLDASGKSNSVDLTNPLKGISIGVAGTLKINTIGGETLEIGSGELAAGVIHPIEIARVWSTGTTATGLFGWW